MPLLWTAWATADETIQAERLSLPGIASSPEGNVAVQCGTSWVSTAPSGSRPEATSLWHAKRGGDSRWVDSGIRVPASSAAVVHGDSVIIIGGMLDGAPVRSVFAASESGSALVSKPLPDLPLPLAGSASAVIDGRLHVFGGLSSVNPPVFERTLWTLDLAGASTWLKATDFPGAPRAFGTAVAQNGLFCVFGGIVAADGGYPVTDETWSFRPKPLEGTANVGWRKGAPAGFPVALAQAVPVGQSSVMLAGGLRTASVPALPPPPPADATFDPWFYQTVTDAWSPCVGDMPEDRGLRLLMAADGPHLLGLNGTWKLSFPRNVRNLTVLDYAVVAGYFIILATIGFWFSKQESSAEFSLGNRKVRWWAAGISMFATSASAISFMAIPALAFATNLVWTLPVVVTLIPAYFITAHLIFPLLRRMEITSTYEYLERRFNRTLRLIASAQCILIQTIGRTSVVLVLPAIAISSVTGMNVFLAVILMGALTTLYTSVGGFDSVIWTEVFQGVLKFIAPLVMIIVAIVALPGGFGEFWKTGIEYRKFECALLTWDVTVPALWILILSYLLQFTVMKAGDQPIIQRVFSAPMSEVRRVSAMDTVCGILIGILSNVLGIAIFSYFRAHPGQFSPNAQNDQIVPMFVTQAMPPGFAGMVIAAIFASAMATVASAMNSVATIYTEDFYPLIRPNADDKRRLRTLKITSYVVGVVGTVMALLLAGTNPKSLMVVWAQIVSLMGGGVVGVYSLGMFTRRVNGFGAVCGAIASIVITLLVKLHTPLHWATYLPVAIVSCMVCGYLFSLLKPQCKNLDGLTVFTPARR
jgi:SSS family transporter